MKYIKNLKQQLGRIQREGTKVLSVEPTDVSVLLLDLFEDLLNDHSDLVWTTVNYPWFQTFLGDLREALNSENFSEENSSDFQFFIESNLEFINQLVYGGETLTHNYDFEVLLSLRKSVKNLQYRLLNLEDV